MAGAVFSVSKSVWGRLRVAPARVRHAIARPATAVRDVVSSFGKTVADRASAMARVSLGLITRARDATSRLVQHEIARRAAVASARRAAAVRPTATSAPELHPGRAAAVVRIPTEQPTRARNTPAARPAVSRTADKHTAPPATASMPQFTDLEDTMATDPPYRFLALAGREGFVVIAKPECGNSDHSEFWLLDEPDSGILLTVVTSDRAVYEAILHYNLRTEDDALLQDTAPEHRDLDSRTIYVRESAVQHFRARCRRLRASGRLVRDWKVSPPIDLPHPSRSTDTGAILPARSSSSAVTTRVVSGLETGD